MAIVVIPAKIALDLHGFWPQPPIFRLHRSLVVELAHQSAAHRTGLRGAQPRMKWRSKPVQSAVVLGSGI